MPSAGGEGVRDVVEAVRGQLGVETNPLRLVSLGDPGDRERRHIVSVLESVSPLWRPPRDLRWITRADLAHLEVETLEHQAFIETTLIEGETERVPTARVPWARRGWYEEAALWIRDRLAEQGMALSGPIELTRVWSLSCVLRCPVGDEVVYFKAATPFFRHEASITAILSRRYPAWIPDLVATDWTRGWLLLRDFGGETLWGGPPEALKEVVKIMAQVQCASTQYIDELIAAGCRDRRLHSLPDDINRLLKHELTNELTGAEDLERLRHLTPVFETLYERLQSIALPDTVLHGDFHPGNAARVNDTYCIFDWTDSCIAHPFFDLLPFLHSLRGDEHALTRQQVVDEYLGSWEQYLPRARLDEAWRITQVLGSLFHAIGYLAITENMEEADRWEIGNGVRGWLQHVLEAELLASY